MLRGGGLFSTSSESLYAIKRTANISFLHAVNKRTNVPAYCMKTPQKSSQSDNFLPYSQIIASAAAPLPLVSRLYSNFVVRK